jgi:hypothetical protein
MAGYPEGAGIPDDHRGTIGALDQGFLEPAGGIAVAQAGQRLRGRWQR